MYVYNIRNKIGIEMPYKNKKPITISIESEALKRTKRVS